MGKDSGQIRQEIEITREEMGDTLEAIGYRANIPRRVKDSLSDTVEAVKDTVAETTSEIRSGFAKLDDNMPDASDLREGVRRVVRTAQRNPLGLVLGAGAIGLLAGLLMPATRFERSSMAVVSERVKKKAREAGREIFNAPKK